MTHFGKSVRALLVCAGAALAARAEKPARAPVFGDSSIRAKAGDSEIVVTTTARVAGAIHSLTWGGKEFVDSFDHGRQIQSASNFDAGGPFVPEVFNPTEAGSLADGTDPVRLSPEQAGWAHCGLRVLRLADGERRTIDTGPDEAVILPLSVTGLTVEAAGERFALQGRTSVFARVSDFAYVGRDTEIVLSADAEGGEVVLATARCSRRLPPRYGAAGDVPIEVRGAGPSTRQVTNFLSPDAWGHADKLMAVELLTPDGNWSSYPPHKHDEQGDGESCLEEIHYFEVAASPAGGHGCGYQRVYGHPDRPIDVCTEVRNGDVVLIPYGWHGPSMAAPGYDLYSLNVMAGPGERRRLVREDPAHGWVRGHWAAEPVDSRLPLTSIREKRR